MSKILRIILGIAALALIITSMVIEGKNAYLAMGLACIAIANSITWAEKRNTNKED
ncbi:MAG: hypothetical protein K5745_02235 [Saccharofermentans sp.]|nr:hypothetical protein [Saccharofermentans sp.]